MSRICSTLYIIAVMGMGLLSSCNRHTVYDHYSHTPIAGWEKNDTLVFNIPKLTVGGMYQQFLGLRINGAYPFMSLYLIVEQTIEPQHRVLTDTLNCRLINQKGISEGQGISYYQYNFPITRIDLQAGDSLHVCIRHGMKRDILPGIADIGLRMIRDDRQPAH